MKITKEYLREVIKESLTEEASYGSILKFYRDTPKELAEMLYNEDYRALMEACERAFMHTYGVTVENYLLDNSKPE
jgi:hypothetical protein